MRAESATLTPALSQRARERVDYFMSHDASDFLLHNTPSINRKKGEKNE
jgi:hypothetical protein